MLSKINPLLDTDPTTGEKLVPIGLIGTCDMISRPGPLTKELGTLPLLSGQFNSEKCDFSTNLPSTVSWGFASIQGALTFIFWLQTGPSAMCWFANPADKYVWEAIEQWHARKTIAVAADFNGKTSRLASHPFELPPELWVLKETIKYQETLTPQFVAGIGTAIVSGSYKEHIESCLPGYPKLEHVQACIVTTPCTGRISVVLDSLQAPLT